MGCAPAAGVARPARRVALSGQETGIAHRHDRAVFADMAVHSLGSENQSVAAPWTDLTLSNPTHQFKASVDPYFPDTSVLQTAAQAYAVKTSLTHPHVSPQFADLSALPPTLIHVGEREAHDPGAAPQSLRVF